MATPSSFRPVSRCCIHAIRRQSTRSTLHPQSASVQQVYNKRAPSRRWESTTAAAAAASSAIDPKISTIIDQISQLTLLETADLVSSLKARLNIPDMPMGGFASGGGGAGPAAAAPAAEDADEGGAPVAQEKTLFALHLKSFDAGSKPKIIKEIKAMLGLSLVDSKKFVEAAPKMMKEGVPKDEAEKIIESLKAVGGVVTME